MAVKTGAGHSETNPAGTRVHKMKKKADVESGACGQETLENKELRRSSGFDEELVRTSEKEREYLLTPELRLS